MFGQLGAYGGFGSLGLVGKVKPVDVSWVLSGASVDMDFANNRYFGGTFANTFTVSRASSKTNLLPTSASGFAYSTFLSNVAAITSGSGFLIEESRINRLLNSTAPVTQTTASLATGTYVLWVNGAGSATSSAGTATITGAGAATNGSPNTFVVTVAGTVTVTVSGALNAFQCELGNVGSSFIVTAGATATRAADNITITGSALTILRGAVGTEMAAGVWSGATTTNHAVLFAAGAAAFTSYASSADNSNHAGATLSGIAALQTATRAFNIGSSDKFISAWQTSNYASSLSGATVVTSASGAALSNTGQTFTLGGTSTQYYFNGTISRITLWNTRLANGLLPGLST